MTKEQFDALVGLVNLQTQLILTLVDSEDAMELRHKHEEAMIAMGDVEFLTQREIAARENDELDRLRTERRARVLQRAKENDPVCWSGSTSGQPSHIRRQIDQARNESRKRAEQELSNEGDAFI